MFNTFIIPSDHISSIIIIVAIVTRIKRLQMHHTYGAYGVTDLKRLGGTGDR